MDGLEVDVLEPLEKVLDEGALADAWCDEPLDFEEQTGADWYAKMLSASLGGKVVHGANIIPACELLAKTTEDFAENYIHGRVGYEPDTLDASRAEDDPIDAPYFGHDYHGTTTASGEVLAYDTGLWEPSSRQRARSAAVLAADMASVTGKPLEAIDAVSIITASEVPIAAVENTMVLLSATKRAAATVSKPNHKIFQMATIQRAVTWEDSALQSDKLPPGAAVDWSKVTLVARYLGEVNCAYDDRFRLYARAKGVPYALIKNAWAWCSDFDSVLDLGDKLKPPALPPDLVPSVTDSLSEHVDSILVTVNSTIQALKEGTTDNAIDALVRIAEHYNRKQGATQKIVSTGAENIAEIRSHKHNAESARAVTSSANTSYEALVEAISGYVTKDRTAKLLLQEVVTDGRQAKNYKLSELANKVLKNVVWKSAADILSQTIGEISTAVTRMARLKRTFGRFSTPWGVEGVYSADSSNRGTFIRLFKDSLLAKPKFVPVKLYQLTETQHVSLKTVQTLANRVYEHLTVYRKAWSERYDAWAAAWASRASNKSHPKAKELSVKYGAAASAFNSVTSAGLMSPDTGYVDLATLPACYLAKAMKNYVKKRRKPEVKTKDKEVHSMADLAQIYDDALKPEVSFVSVELFVRERLKMLADDLKDGSGEPTVSGGADDMELTETKVEASVAPPAAAPSAVDTMALMMKMFASAPRVTEQKVAATYPTPEMAEEHAKANGYSSFHEAYEKLKEKARFDDASDYTAIGMSAAKNAEPASAGDAIV
jgi:hypothetical protein